MESLEINNESYSFRLLQRNGSMPYVMMLHGFLGDHRVFGHLLGDMKEFCNPLAVDLLGYGQSSCPRDPGRYNEYQQTGDIIRLIEKLNLTPLILFGYSMGGRLALKTALSAPRLLDGLILESTTCGIRDEGERKGRQAADEQRARQIEDNYEAFLTDWQRMEIFHSPLHPDKEVRGNYRLIQHSQNPGAVAASLRGFGTGSMTPVCDQLKNFDLPVLLMAGSEDEKYQRMNQGMAKQFPNAAFSSIKASHRTHLDNPAAFIQEIKKHINMNS